ncbi:MAG: sigma-70 family RNA polymerase sigma factor [Ruminococcus sp.]|nr:sigma-70 family RNA polymerase sigma factor [Ruminococcus sp.]
MGTEVKAEENLGLVHLCANRFRGKGIDYDDLYSAGCLGLLKAVKAFDSDRGVKFSTYAVPVILGEIKRLFRDGGTLKVSRSLKELSMKLQRICQEFMQREGREPAISELSTLTGESEADISEALCSAQPLISLTSPEDDEGQIDVPVEAPDEQILDLLALRQVMAMLPESDRMLLELRYFRNMTQSAAAKILGMTQVQVSRYEKKLLTRLRKELVG